MSTNIPYKILLEQLPLVSKQDKFITSINKWQAHSHQYMKQSNSMPHRAFSIFIFNDNYELLLQKRSSLKKTFPLCWSNSCCSHPNMIQYSDENKTVQPIRSALHRALHRELMMDLTTQTFLLCDKVLYQAHGSQQSIYGEYEVDYIFICKLQKQPTYTMVAEEVSQVAWVSQQQLHHFIKNKQSNKQQFSPWFLLINHNQLLNQWWTALKNNTLSTKQDHCSVTQLIY